VDGEDRLSVLADDILLSVLGRVDITTAVRTCVLSVQWKHLPWLLPELTIDVKDFLPALQSNPIDTEHMDEAMSSLTKATRSFLANPRSEGAITKLQLKLYLINNYACDIGLLLSEAIDIGILKDLNLAILDEKEIEDCTEEQMLEQGSAVNGFFSAYPSVFQCLTRLSLYNLCFDEWDINHHLFECCKQLQHLYLSNCAMERCLVWKIDAPGSNLRVLQLNVCLLGRLDVLCLPKLERLEWDAWLCPRAPLSFGVVPSLKELCLICAASNRHRGFLLSEVLKDTMNLHTIKLDFQGEKVSSPAYFVVCIIISIVMYNAFRILKLFKIRIASYSRLCMTWFIPILTMCVHCIYTCLVFLIAIYLEALYSKSL
jgi:hypothetical protein